LGLNLIFDVQSGAPNLVRRLTVRAIIERPPHPRIGHRTQERQRGGMTSVGMAADYVDQHQSSMVLICRDPETPK